MSVYTTKIKDIVENYLYNMDMSLDDRIDAAIPIIFNFKIPLDDQEHIIEIENKFIRHFFMREIGFETFGLWQFYLRERCIMIAPKYNDLYETVNNKYNYLWNTNYKETYSGITNFNEAVKNLLSSSSLVNTDSTTKDSVQTVSSDLPQTTLNGKDYATTSSESDSNGSSNTETSNQTNQQGNSDTERKEDKGYTIERTGSNGGASLTSLMVEYRNSIINVDEMFINEFDDLFMNIY